MRVWGLGVVGVALLLTPWTPAAVAGGAGADRDQVVQLAVDAGRSEAVRHASRPSTRPVPSDVPEPVPAHHVSAAGGDISGVADQLFALAGPRFAGLRVDEARRHIAAYWAGEIPAAAAKYAASSPGGITIELDDRAPYTRTELRAAAERVAASDLGRGARVSSVAARGFEGPGLHIHVEAEVPSRALAQAIARLAELPLHAITYTPHAELVPLSAPRIGADVPPK